MTSKTDRSDTTRPPKADNRKLRKHTNKNDHRKKSKLSVTNGRIVARRRNAGEKTSKAPDRTIRTHFDLRQETFARMTGLSQDVLAQWEQGKNVRLGDDARIRIGRVASILESLARVMRREFVPTWIEQPNDACKEIGATTPLDLFERGELESLEDMAWYLESGTPG